MGRNRIFRAGLHITSNGDQVEIKESDLIRCCEVYDRGKHEAPLVVGHPVDNAPAYGWVEKLQLEGGELFAESGQVDENFSELVNKGRFKKISASFYRPDASSNPVQGVWYLRHVGFLGAMPPAVKGLGDARFNESKEDYVTFEEKEKEEVVEKAEETVEKVQAVDFAEENAILNRRRDEIAELEKRLNHEQVEWEVKKRVDAKKINEIVAKEVIAFLDKLDSKEVVTFGEGKTQSMMEWFFNFIDKNQVVEKQIVNLGEVSREPEQKVRSVMDTADQIAKLVASEGLQYHDAFYRVTKGV